MSSPVLDALKDTKITCRHPDCDNTYSPIDPYDRFTPHRFNRYCSKLCHQKAIKEYKQKSKNDD